MRRESKAAAATALARWGRPPNRQGGGPPPVGRWRRASKGYKFTSKSRNASSLGAADRGLGCGRLQGTRGAARYPVGGCARARGRQSSSESGSYCADMRGAGSGAGAGGGGAGAGAPGAPPSPTVRAEYG